MAPGWRAIRPPRPDPPGWATLSRTERIRRCTQSPPEASLSPIEILAILGAGLVAGTVNTIVGSGSLVSFPTLLAFGYPPILANVSNSVGLVPGSLSGAFGYRRELSGQRPRMIRLGAAGGLGGLTGGILLLALPASTFFRIVPFLILGACLLIAIQPRLSRELARHRPHGAEHSRFLLATVYAVGVYGGYFGAGQGVMLIAVLAIFVPDHLQRLNGLKNVIAIFNNGVAVLLFIAISPVAWGPAALLAVGSITGGQVGAHIGRRLHPVVLRVIIVCVGTAVALRMLAG